MKLRNPFSGLSHLAGVLLSAIGIVFLLVAAHGRTRQIVSFAIYGAALIFLYSASALYHLLRLPPRKEARLFGLDRAAIYALIAGTYTPLCLVVLPPAWGWSLLGVVWGFATIGIVVDAVSCQRAPDWLQAVLYLATGWVAIAAVVPLFHALSAAALAWLLAGCLIYSAGAVICVTDRPLLWPRVFGAHDLWHVLVLVGSACHFVVMLRFVAPM